jgi:hypothetical protein
MTPTATASLIARLIVEVEQSQSFASRSWPGKQLPPSMFAYEASVNTTALALKLSFASRTARCHSNRNPEDF